MIAYIIQINLHLTSYKLTYIILNLLTSYKSKQFILNNTNTLLKRSGYIEVFSDNERRNCLEVEKKKIKVLRPSVNVQGVLMHLKHLSASPSISTRRYHGRGTVFWVTPNGQAGTGSGHSLDHGIGTSTSSPSESYLPALLHAKHLAFVATTGNHFHILSQHEMPHKITAS